MKQRRSRPLAFPTDDVCVLVALYLNARFDDADAAERRECLADAVRRLGKSYDVVGLHEAMLEAVHHFVDHDATKGLRGRVERSARFKAMRRAKGHLDKAIAAIEQGNIWLGPEPIEMASVRAVRDALDTDDYLPPARPAGRNWQPWARLRSRLGNLDVDPSDITLIGQALGLRPEDE